MYAALAVGSQVQQGMCAVLYPCHLQVEQL